MIDRFLSFFHPKNTNDRTTESITSNQDVIRSLAGLSFNDGLYRVHDPLQADKWDRIVTSIFHQYLNRINCFGYDWLGRQFAVDLSEREGRKLQVLMFEVGAGKVHQIPADIIGFHNDILVDMAEPALEMSLYCAWRNAGNAAPTSSQCAGYKLAPILGGRDEITNLALTDMEVEWQITRQILEVAARLPKGSRIDKATLGNRS